MFLSSSWLDAVAVAAAATVVAYRVPEIFPCLFEIEFLFWNCNHIEKHDLCICHNYRSATNEKKLIYK